MSNADLLPLFRESPERSVPEHAEHPSVCFVTPLSIADFVDPDLTLKGSRYIMAGNIGILTLAAQLGKEGYKVQILNLDQLFLQFLGVGKGSSEESVRPARVSDPQEFFQFVAARLTSLSFDVFGFGSICSSYPMTVRLARETRNSHPRCRIIVGGPQASVVDVSTMLSFPWIDYVVRGEAEDTLVALLARLSRGESAEGIPGVTFRREGEVIRNPNAPPIEDLDRLPMPAFHLDPDFMSRGSVYLEIGRGCPFACTFCSTNDFFRRNFRLKSTSVMLEEMKQVKQEYKLGSFSLIHDMYTIDRKEVIGFCNAVMASGEDFTWSCSARTDCVDEELLTLMAKAGCRGIFYGIETGSQRLQKIINKKLDLAEAWQHIAAADRNGIKIAVALITAFPDETRDDLRDTIHFFIDSSRFEHAEPQLSLLAPLAATPIYEEHKNHLVLDDIFSDMSHQGWQQDPGDTEMIRSYPDVFPNFYAVPTRWLPRAYFKEVRDFVTYITTWLHWLPVALRQDSGDFLKVFDLWKKWLATQDRGEREAATGNIPYFSHRRFRCDFLEFVETCYMREMCRAKAAIAALVRSESMERARKTKAGFVPVERVEALEGAVYPFQEETLLLMDVDVDYKDLVERLRTGRDVTEIPEKKVTIVYRPRSERRVQIWQLSPLSAAVIRLCDGTRTADEIAREFARAGYDTCGVAPETACLFGLAALRKDGLVGFSSEPLRGEEPAVEAEEVRELQPEFSRPPQMSNTQQPWPWGQDASAGVAVGGAQAGKR